MSDYPIYCSEQTYRATRESPAEWCENEVEQEGDLCDKHDTDARATDEYDRYLQMKDDH